MTAADPAARLQALADHYRRLAEVTPLGGERSMLFALAEHVESVNVGHQLGPDEYVCATCGEQYPCTDVRTLLAVADAAGVTP